MKPKSKGLNDQSITRFPARVLDFFDIIDPNAERNALIEEALDILNLADREFVSLRYGVAQYSEDGPLSQTELAKIYHKPQYVICRMEKRIIKMLNEKLHKKRFFGDK